MLRSASIALLLLFALATPPPAFAQKKRSDGGEVQTEEQPKPKRSKKRGATTPPASEDKAAEDAPKVEETGEPDAWERPPADVEKPPAAPPKQQETRVGDGKHLSLGLLLGGGVLTDRKPGQLGTDPYGWSVGVRGGYSFDIQLYLGLFYTYYLGTSVTGEVGSSIVVTTTKANYMQFGAEVGYDLWAGSLIVRPSLQIGVALGIVSKENTPSPLTSFLLAPGVTVVMPIDSFFFGGDMRFALAQGDGAAAFTLNATGGLRFE